MRTEVFSFVKKEFQYLGLLFLLALIIFKIVYFKESLIVLVRYVISLFWLFAFPGYFIMLYWREKLDFTERVVIGIALSAAIIGIFSYYIGLMGVNVKYHGIFMPIIIIVLMAIIISKKSS